MKKLEKGIHWYLVILFPFIIGFFIWASMIVEPAVIKAATLAQKDLITQTYSGGTWDYIGYIIMVWYALALITLGRLLYSSSYREEILANLGMIKERDEREAEITGFASKFSMIASIAFLMCLLFFNSMNFGVKKQRIHPVEADGKTQRGTVTVGFRFSVIDYEAIKIVNNENEKEFSYKELPLTKNGTIVLIILWQIGMFALAARRKKLNDIY